MHSFKAKKQKNKKQTNKQKNNAVAGYTGSWFQSSLQSIITTHLCQVIAYDLLLTMFTLWCLYCNMLYIARVHI